jgi:hypothetical protein
MTRFSIDRWLEDRGFGVVHQDTWWAFPAGWPCMGIDVRREGQTCIIEEYRDGVPPRQAVGTRQVYTRAQYQADTGDVDLDFPEMTWLEYRFPWPRTEAQAEAIAEQMGWNAPQEPPPA